MKFLVLVLFFPAIVLAKGFGIVTIVKGSPVVQNDKGEQKPLAKGAKVFESDTIITSATSLVRLVMMDTNIIDVYPNSKLLIKEYVYNPKENLKNVSLEVAEGKIKSTVKQKYDNDKNKYNVKTPVIVAGVRGTTFLAEHEVKSNRSKIFTQEGHVMVGKLEANQQVKEFFSVLANQKISIDQSQAEKPKVVDVPKAEVEKQKSDDKADGFVKKGKDDSAGDSQAGVNPPPNKPPGVALPPQPKGDNSAGNPPPKIENRKDETVSAPPQSDNGKKFETAPIFAERGGGALEAGAEAPASKEPPKNDRVPATPPKVEMPKDVPKEIPKAIEAAPRLIEMPRDKGDKEKGYRDKYERNNRRDNIENAPKRQPNSVEKPPMERPPVYQQPPASTIIQEQIKQEQINELIKQQQELINSGRTEGGATNLSP